MGVNRRDWFPFVFYKTIYFSGCSEYKGIKRNFWGRFIFGINLDHAELLGIVIFFYLFIVEKIIQIVNLILFHNLNSLNYIH
jgi:hypothetical protein